MRQTEYVGLTKKAQQFVAQLKKLDSDTTTEGMNQEIIQLNKWEVDGEYLEEGVVVREVVQAAPWSSGSLIFTCLEVEYLNGQKIRFHQWVADPTLKDKQYDACDGVMWI